MPSLVCSSSSSRDYVRAKSRAAGATDAGTTRLVGLSFGTVLVGTPLLSRLDLGRMAVPGIIGPAVMALGLGLRVWAARVLGRVTWRLIPFVYYSSLQ